MKNYTVDDIMSMMANGMSADDIAKQFTDTLNAAVKAQKEDKVKQERVADLQIVINGLLGFVKKYYPDMFDEKVAADIDAERIDQAIIEAYEEVQQMKGVLDDLFTNKKPVADIKKTRNDNDAINAFLKRYNLQ